MRKPVLLGKIIGAGNLTINKLNETAAADLSGISTEGTTIVNNAASSTTFAGKIPSNCFYMGGSGTVIMSNGIPTTNDMTVGGGVTFQATAVNEDGKKIKGGNVTINNQNDDPAAESANVTTGTTAVNTSDNTNIIHKEFPCNSTDDEEHLYNYLERSYYC